MTNDAIFSHKDFKECVNFHGHICPGLSIGYKAAKAGLDWLKEHRAEDEEIVTVVETNACSADAIQVLTGCTFGKGNLIYKDHGKQAFTLLDRQSGKGVRVALKSGVIDLSDRHRELIQKVRTGRVSAEEHSEFISLHIQKSQEILEKSPGELFILREADTSLPPKAEIEASETCSCCGEPTMQSKLVNKNGLKVCKDCKNKDVA